MSVVKPSSRSPVNRRSTRHAMCKHKQRGAVMAFTAIGLLALLAVTGLALDMGDVYINKTRLQNALDAAALSAAKELVLSDGDTAAATAAARATFSLNKDEGNEDLAVIANTDVDVEFSATLYPWVPNSGAVFVRTSVTSFSRESVLISVLGIDEKQVIASATAGPEQAGCSRPFPLMVCGFDPLGPDTPPDAHDPSAGKYYGYEVGEQVVLKRDSSGCDEVDPVTGDPGTCNGPGNFNVLDVGSGADAVRDAICGKGTLACVAEGDIVETNPGNMAGPIAQSVNTRFNDFSGPLKPGDCAADTNTTEYPETGFNHFSLYKAGEPGTYNKRRLVPITVGECTDAGGHKDVSVLDTMCFLLTRKVIQAGNLNEVYGEFVDPTDPIVGTCLTTGQSSPDSTGSGGPVILVLYKDQVMTDG